MFDWRPTGLGDREKDVKSIFKEIMAEKFPLLMKKICKSWVTRES